MATFMCFMNWTEQGAKGAKDSNKRYQITKGLVEKLGGKLLSAYVVTGQYDVVFVADMPNGEAMVKLTVALAASGNVRTTTQRAFSTEEFAKLAAEAPTF
jgi:uncharacterized protein with GYD domain